MARSPRPTPLAPSALLAALAACALAACAHPPEAPAPAPAPPPATHYHPEDVPRELLPAVTRADAAIRALRERLAAKVTGEVAASGPRRAIASLHDAVPALAAAISAQTGVEVGRTSGRPRTEAGAPRAWAAPLVADAQGRKAADVAPAVVDLGDRVGVLRPIAVQASCLACHGGPERVAPEVRAAIEATYPEDRAIGLAEGDLLGFFWAEAKK